MQRSALADVLRGQGMFLTCYPGQLEVRGSREGHRWNSKCVNLCRRLHRGGVLRWGREINLILKVVIKLLTHYKSHLNSILVTMKKYSWTVQTVQTELAQNNWLYFTHLEVDLLLFAAGSTVEQQYHKGHQHSQRQQQRDGQREIHISSSLCWTQTPD